MRRNTLITAIPVAVVLVAGCTARVPPPIHTEPSGLSEAGKSITSERAQAILAPLGQVWIGIPSGNDYGVPSPQWRVEVTVPSASVADPCWGVAQGKKPFHGRVVMREHSGDTCEY